ncbi:MAG: hypothetical protein HQL25_08950, partial [Candidatus Omnitrophica bacterium]|nr:hypothetical protein [Candidatus Omnitrophota bacterium]
MSAPTVSSNITVPLLVKGLILDPQDPFKFNFIVDTGSNGFNKEQVTQEAQRLINYFFAGLTVPKKDLWVNLSPTEKDRIIPELLGQTELGRDMLTQDYILKQITADLLNPNNEIGQKFWDKVYKQTYEKFGKTDISTESLSKVWIIPEKAEIYADGNKAYVIGAHLKVMMGEEYLAGGSPVKSLRDHGVNNNHILSAQTALMKEIIIPVLEQEINQGKDFVLIRQIFNSLILARWYRDYVLNSAIQKYYVDKNKISGINLENKNIKDEVYAQYLAQFKKGVFEFIKEDYDAASQKVIPRKYFSGGITEVMDFAMVVKPNPGSVPRPSGQLVNVRVGAGDPGAVIPGMVGSRKFNVKRVIDEAFDELYVQDGVEIVELNTNFLNRLQRNLHERGVDLIIGKIKEFLLKTSGYPVQGNVSKPSKLIYGASGSTPKAVIYGLSKIFNMDSADTIELDLYPLYSPVAVEAEKKQKLEAELELIDSVFASVIKINEPLRLYLQSISNLIKRRVNEKGVYAFAILRDKLRRLTAAADSTNNNFLEIFGLSDISDEQIQALEQLLRGEILFGLSEHSSDVQSEKEDVFRTEWRMKLMDALPDKTKFFNTLKVYFDTTQRLEALEKTHGDHSTVKFLKIVQQKAYEELQEILVSIDEQKFFDGTKLTTIETIPNAVDANGFQKVQRTIAEKIRKSQAFATMMSGQLQSHTGGADYKLLRKQSMDEGAKTKFLEMIPTLQAFAVRLKMRKYIADGFCDNKRNSPTGKLRSFKVSNMQFPTAPRIPTIQT